jgi:pyruvate/2-oxoglutarate dehydrogenase complex dihydrolipoamide dehydrogenase (E3) component
MFILRVFTKTSLSKLHSNSLTVTLLARNMSTSSYAAIIIGSGQAGGPLAQAFAKAGHRTALIESTHIGGTCVNEGCTPTKTMVASARVSYLARRGTDYGVDIDKPFKMNMETVRKRKRDIVNSFRGGNESRIKSTTNLDLFMGQAKFIGEKEIAVTSSGDGVTKVINGDKIFINAGCFPTPLLIPGADQVEVLNSTSIMELDVVPEHLLVIGGGYVGVEFAQMFRRFGARVTIIQRSNQLLAREDPDVADAVRDILTEDGIEIMFGATTKSVQKLQLGTVELTVIGADGTSRTLQGSHILSAAGRTPSTSLLQPSAAGVEMDKHGFIKVSDALQTNVSHIFALGDIKGGPQFTHISYDDFRVIRHNFITNPTDPSQTIKDRLVPYTVFMDPQLGRIGLSESEARKMFSDKGRVKVAKMPMSYVARALEMDEARGFIKVIVDGSNDQILGAAVLGIEGGEVMTMLQIAMMGSMRWQTLQDGVFAHPGLGELLNNVWGFLE